MACTMLFEDCRIRGIQEFGKSGIQEFRNSGIQEFRNSWIQEFRNSGIQEVRNSGIQEIRKSGSQWHGGSGMVAKVLAFRPSVAWWQGGGSGMVAEAWWQWHCSRKAALPKW